MKTKTLIACLATGLLALGQPVRAAANPSHTTSFEPRHNPRQTHRPAALSTQNISGVIPRATPAATPLPLLNPLARTNYATAEDDAELIPGSPAKRHAINLSIISS